MSLQNGAQLLHPAISVLNSFEAVAWAFQEFDAASTTERLPVLEHHVKCVSICEILKCNEIISKSGTKVTEKSACACNEGTRLVSGHHFQSVFHDFPLIIRYAAFAQQYTFDNFIDRARRQNFPIDADSCHEFSESGGAREYIRRSHIFLKNVQIIEEIHIKRARSPAQYLIDGKFQNVFVVGARLEQFDREFNLFGREKISLVNQASSRVSMRTF